MPWEGLGWRCWGIRCTLPETNIVPANRASEKEISIPIPTIHFQVLCFRGCNRFFFNFSSMWFTDVHYFGLTSFAAIAMFFFSKELSSGQLVWFDLEMIATYAPQNVMMCPKNLRRKMAASKQTHIIYIYIYMPYRDLSERVPQIPSSHRQVKSII